MGKEMSIEPYPNRQFGIVDDPDCQSGCGSDPTWTQTRSDGPEPLLTLFCTERFSLATSNPCNVISHQQKTFPSGRNGSVRVDALRQSRQRHPGGGLLRARRQYHVSRCTSPSDRSFAVSSSDSARAFSDAPESTCSYGGVFRTLRELTIRIVKFWSSWDCCAALWETWCRILKAVVLRVP